MVAQQPLYMGAPKSKVAAALFAVFLGFLGIHNFYLGHTKRAVVQLLITVLSCGYAGIVSWIWAFVEFVLILTGSYRDKFGRSLI
jgi:TM2 domain-containing membrane protein YozV